MKRRKFLKYLGIGTAAAATGASIAIAAPERLVVHAPPRHAMSGFGEQAFIEDFHHQVVSEGFAITEEAMEDSLYESLNRRYTKALTKGLMKT